ncbi:MAG: single-stranded DNA-binding protein [Candidatus Saganbacteria bacterium]|nr:single-stranded DNA-binding protein [Candidatus Saganbacteria bacterium]
MSLNRMILTGTLTRDPELRYTKEEIPVARFTVAIKSIQRKGKDKDTQYFNCVAWRGLASIVGEYLKKGSLVAIEGKLQIKPYESKGMKKHYTEIVVDNLLMLDKKFYGKAIPSAESEDVTSEEGSEIHGQCD